MTRVRMLAILLATGMLGDACGRAVPTAADRQVHSSLLEGMKLEATQWPDTMTVGQRAPAAVQLLLANGVPYSAATINWFSMRPSVAGLYPTESAASKVVLASAPDTVSIWVGAFVPKTKRPESIDDYYHTEIWLHLVVLPGP